MTTLKPVSDAMRRALALLGEDPEDHQREKAGQRIKPRGKKLPFTSSKLETTSSVAARLVAKIPEPVWLADARVLFTRTRTCRSCGHVAREMHWTETFIRQRSKDDPQTFKYIPARSALFAFLELPKISVDLPIQTFYCPSCWRDEAPLENPVCLAELVSFPQDDTRSSGESVAQTNGLGGPFTSASLSEPTLLGGFTPEASEPSEPSQISPSSIEEASFVSHKELGSAFASFDDNSLALANLTLTHTG